MRVSFDLTFPEDVDLPSQSYQPLDFPAVSLPVTLELPPPEFPIRPWKGQITSRASMPIAAMYEDGDPLSGKCYVWPPGSPLPVLPVAAEADVPQSPAKQDFGPRLSRTIRFHDLGNGRGGGGWRGTKGWSAIPSWTPRAFPSRGGCHISHGTAPWKVSFTLDRSCS